MCSDALNQRIEFDCLFDCHLGEDGVVLWAVPDELPGILELLLNIIALDCDLTGRRVRLSRQTLERGRLASSIDTQQGETLSIIQPKRGLLDSADWRSTESIVLLLEIVHADAVKVGRISCSLLTAEHGIEHIGVSGGWVDHGCGDRAALTSDLHGHSLLLSDHIIVLDHWRALPIALARLKTDSWAPAKVLVDLELDQS